MAASNFNQSLAHVLRHEGGYVNHPADPGGPTKYGITLAVYRENGRPGATAADVRSMTVAEAGAIYRARYWDVLCCDALPAGLDYAVFDYGVNSGVGRAARVLRHLCGFEGQGTRIDTTTLAAVRRRDTAELAAALCDERLAFLKRLRTWSVFGRGWARRVSEVRAAALEMAAQVEGGDQTGPAIATAREERLCSGAQPPASGKGVVAVNRAAQNGTAAGAAVTGVAAAERAHDAGAPVGLVIVILAVAVLVAVGGFFLWRWRAAREQARIVVPQKGASA